MADDSQQATMKNADLLAKCPPNDQQRFDQLGKIREAFDKFPDAHLELKCSHHTYLEAEVAQSPAQPDPTG